MSAPEAALVPMHPTARPGARPAPGRATATVHHLHAAPVVTVRPVRGSRVDLRLFFELLTRIEDSRPAREVVVDLSGAGPVTDSGSAALLAMDRLVARRGIRMAVVNAGPDVILRMKPLCPATRWRVETNGSPVAQRAHSPCASTP